MRVLKYKLDIIGKETKFQFHRGTKFLHFAWYRDSITVWALVPDETVRVVNKTLVAYATGEEIGDEINHLEYLATCLVGNEFVWHIFLVDE